MRSIAAGLVLILAGTAGCNAQRELAGKRRNTIERSLMRAVYLKGLQPEKLRLSARMSFYRVPGVSLCAFDKNAVEWSRAYGEADAQTHRPLTPETVFQAGGLGQMMTAAAALRLAEKGTVDLDEDVRGRLKAWAFPADVELPRGKLTLRMLLTHSGGLSEQLLDGYAPGESLPTIPQVLSGLKPAKNAPVWSPPRFGANRKAWVSEGGYTLVQQVLEDAAGMTFGALMKQMIIDPLGLKNTAFAADLDASAAAGAAVGHSRDGAALPGRWRRYPETAAKGLWTTASDYAGFLCELMREAMGESDRILSPAAARAMLAPQIENFSYGFLADGNGDGINFHVQGKTAGFAAAFVVYPAKGQGIVLLANSDNGDILEEEILAAASAAYEWPHYKPVEKDVLRLSAEAYQEFVGRFEVNPAYALDVTWTDYYLVIRPTGQAPTKFYAEGQTLFYSTDPYIRIQFYKDKTGAVTNLDLWQKDFELEARKVR
ncbi:MAG: serine hydrolase domain-containing protein [Candidatus Aminicenantales bacterium]